MHFRIRILGRLVILLILSSYTGGAYAQEMWGITMSNFAGSNSALLNPSGIVTSKLYLDINIATAGVFLENNYLYIHAEDYSLFKYLGNDPQWPEYGPDDMPFDHYSSPLPKQTYASVFVKGPSFMLARGRHAVALHTGVRYLTSLTNIPYHIANFAYYGLDFEEQHNVHYRNTDANMGAIAFGEVGLSYAYAFRKYGFDDWSAGITIRRLFGISGAYMNATDINYMAINDSTLDVRNINGEFGFSLPMNYANNDFPDGPNLKGGGWGVDLGITYQRKVLTYQQRRFTKYCRQRYTDYIYKIGLSLLDIGSVRFTENAQYHSYDDVSRYWYNVDTVSYYNMNQLMGSLSDVFYNDPQGSYRGNEISVFLPAAVSLQVDYKLFRGWYAGGAFIYPLPLSKNGVVRPTQIMVAPRYETPSLEASLPVSLYNWRYPRVGLAVRYHILTLGTDNLASLLGFSDFKGLDFYISLKFNFRKGNCWGWGSSGPCENFEYGINRKR